MHNAECTRDKERLGGMDGKSDVSFTDEPPEICNKWMTSFKVMFRLQNQFLKIIVQHNKVYGEGSALEYVEIYISLIMLDWLYHHKMLLYYHPAHYIKLDIEICPRFSAYTQETHLGWEYILYGKSQLLDCLYCHKNVNLIISQL